jgi:transposase InsO family protein
MEIASDRGREYTASATTRFLKDWDVRHRLSSAYFPHSNQCAELGVKNAKRMLRENVSTTGNLDTDAFKRALLTHHNNPDRNTGLSQAR